MNNWTWKAIKVGINLKIKGIFGLPYRGIIKHTWDMSAEEFRCYQANAFRQIYAFARSRVPFYQERPDFYPPLPVNEANVMEFLAKLPILPKQTVKEHNSSFWPRPRLPLTKIHTTSGTTGAPLQCAANLWEKGFAQANYGEWMFRLCGRRNLRSLHLSGFMIPTHNDLYWTDPLTDRVYLSIYSLTPGNRDAIIKLIKDFQPTWIAGFSSSVYQLALLLDDALVGSKDTRLGVVTSEVLQPQWRVTIERLLCKRLYNFYSSLEGSHGVMECSHGEMHVNPIYGILELLDDQGQPAKPRTLGRVVITSLLRRSMPLIRYELNDVAEAMQDISCPCGLHWPVIGAIEGRSEDLVVTRDGRRLGYLCQYCVKDLKGIKEAQIIQTGYENFIVNIVKLESQPVENSYLESSIKAVMEKRLQTEVNIEFRYLAAIPRGPRGKFKAVMVDFS